MQHPQGDLWDTKEEVLIRVMTLQYEAQERSQAGDTDLVSSDGM